MPVCGKFPSSMTPSQSLSMPSQTSGWGMLVTLQTSLPFLQTIVPAWQAPRPLPHFSPTPGSVPSSICPSQLSSMPLQTSAWGVMTGALQTVSVPRGVADQQAVAVAGALEAVVALGADRPVE